jgi:uncharacterized membrane protein YoaT (DUF817 family)
MQLKSLAYEFWVFGLKQAYACIFAGLFLAAVIVSHFYYPVQGLHRYDFLFLVAVLIQVGLLLGKLETSRECIVIIVFHVVATFMELFKTAVGSWLYPDPALIKIMGVPLFAGFMYSAVGSYIARVWRIFRFRFTYFPAKWSLSLVSALIYVNFFTHHYIVDLRWLALAMIVVMMRRTQVYFTVRTEERHMPLLLGLSLVALFIWFAENIATYCRVWFYPAQVHGWTMVSPTKLVAWFLLMFISFTLIALLHGDEAEPKQKFELPS